MKSLKAIFRRQKEHSGGGGGSSQHGDDLSRASSISNLNAEAAGNKSRGALAKVRKSISKDRLDNVAVDKKLEKKSCNKNNNQIDAVGGGGGEEIGSLQQKLEAVSSEKGTLMLQLGEQRGQLGVLQKEISRLKMFQEQSSMQLEQLSDENAALRNKLRDVVHSPLSDNEKQMLLLDSQRHHSSAPASIAANLLGGDGGGGDSTACTTPDWDKQSSSNVSDVSVACLQDKINQMQETHYSTNEELQATLQELTDLQRQLTELQQDNEHLLEEKNLMFDSLCRQTERLNDARVEMDSLKQLLYREKDDTSGGQYESVVEREQKLVDLLKGAQEEREMLLVKQEQINNEIQDARTTILQRENENLQLGDRVRTLESTLDAKHAEHKQLDQEMARAKDKASSRQIEIDRLTDLLENARTKIIEIEQDRELSDKSELDELLDNTRKEKDTLESEVAHLKEQIARGRNETEKLREQVSILQEECKVLRNNAKCTQSELEYKVDKLTLEKASLSDQLQRVEEAANELQVQIQCQLEDKRQLSSVLSETQRNMSEVERCNIDLEGELKEVKKLRNEENEEWDKFQNDLLTSVRVANDFKTEAQQELQKLIMENKAHREKIRNLESQLEKMKDTLCSTIADIQCMKDNYVGGLHGNTLISSTGNVREDNRRIINDEDKNTSTKQNTGVNSCNNLCPEGINTMKRNEKRSIIINSDNKLSKSSNKIISPNEVMKILRKKNKDNISTTTIVSCMENERTPSNRRLTDVIIKTKVIDDDKKVLKSIGKSNNKEYCPSSSIIEDESEPIEDICSSNSSKRSEEACIKSNRRLTDEIIKNKVIGDENEVVKSFGKPNNEEHSPLSSIIGTESEPTEDICSSNSSKRSEEACIKSNRRLTDVIIKNKVIGEENEVVKCFGKSNNEEHCTSSSIISGESEPIEDILSSNSSKRSQEACIKKPLIDDHTKSIKPTNNKAPKSSTSEEHLIVINKEFSKIDPTVPFENLLPEQQFIVKLKRSYETQLGTTKLKPVANRNKNNLAISKPLLSSVYSNPTLREIAENDSIASVEENNIVEVPVDFTYSGSLRVLGTQQPTSLHKKHSFSEPNLASLYSRIDPQKTTEMLNDEEKYVVELKNSLERTGLGRKNTLKKRQIKKLQISTPDLSSVLRNEKLAEIVANPGIRPVRKVERLEGVERRFTRYQDAAVGCNSNKMKLDVYGDDCFERNVLRYSLKTGIVRVEKSKSLQEEEKAQADLKALQFQFGSSKPDLIEGVGSSKELQSGNSSVRFSSIDGDDFEDVNGVGVLKSHSCPINAFDRGRDRLLTFKPVQDYKRNTQSLLLDEKLIGGGSFEGAMDNLTAFKPVQDYRRYTHPILLDVQYSGGESVEGDTGHSSTINPVQDYKPNSHQLILHEKFNDVGSFKQATGNLTTFKPEQDCRRNSHPILLDEKLSDGESFAGSIDHLSTFKPKQDHRRKTLPLLLDEKFTGRESFEASTDYLSSLKPQKDYKRNSHTLLLDEKLNDESFEGSTDHLSTVKPQQEYKRNSHPLLLDEKFNDGESFEGSTDHLSTFKPQQDHKRNSHPLLLAEKFNDRKSVEGPTDQLSTFKPRQDYKRNSHALLLDEKLNDESFEGSTEHLSTSKPQKGYKRNSHPLLLDDKLSDGESFEGPTDHLSTFKPQQDDRRNSHPILLDEKLIYGESFEGSTDHLSTFKPQQDHKRNSHPLLLDEKLSDGESFAGSIDHLSTFKPQQVHKRNSHPLLLDDKLNDKSFEVPTDHLSTYLPQQNHRQNSHAILLDEKLTDGESFEGSTDHLSTFKPQQDYKRSSHPLLVDEKFNDGKSVECPTDKLSSFKPQQDYRRNSHPILLDEKLIYGESFEASIDNLSTFKPQQVHKRNSQPLLLDEKLNDKSFEVPTDHLSTFNPQQNYRQNSHAILLDEKLTDGESFEGSTDHSSYFKPQQDYKQNSHPLLADEKFNDGKSVEGPTDQLSSFKPQQDYKRNSHPLLLHEKLNDRELFEVSTDRLSSFKPQQDHMRNSHPFLLDKKYNVRGASSLILFEKFTQDTQSFHEAQNDKKCREEIGKLDEDTKYNTQKVESMNKVLKEIPRHYEDAKQHPFLLIEEENYNEVLEEYQKLSTYPTPCTRLILQEGYNKDLKPIPTRPQNEKLNNSSFLQENSCTSVLEEDQKLSTHPKPSSCSNLRGEGSNNVVRGIPTRTQNEKLHNSSFLQGNSCTSVLEEEQKLSTHPKPSSCSNLRGEGSNNVVGGIPMQFEHAKSSLLEENSGRKVSEVLNEYSTSSGHSNLKEEHYSSYLKELPTNSVVKHYPPSFLEEKSCTHVVEEGRKLSAYHKPSGHLNLHEKEYSNVLEDIPTISNNAKYNPSSLLEEMSCAKVLKEGQQFSENGISSGHSYLQEEDYSNVLRGNPMNSKDSKHHSASFLEEQNFTEILKEGQMHTALPNPSGRWSLQENYHSDVSREIPTNSEDENSFLVENGCCNVLGEHQIHSVHPTPFCSSSLHEEANRIVLKEIPTNFEDAKHNSSAVLEEVSYVRILEGGPMLSAYPKASCSSSLEEKVKRTVLRENLRNFDDIKHKPSSFLEEMSCEKVLEDDPILVAYPKPSSRTALQEESHRHVEILDEISNYSKYPIPCKRSILQEDGCYKFLEEIPNRFEDTNQSSSSYLKVKERQKILDEETYGNTTPHSSTVSKIENNPPNLFNLVDLNDEVLQKVEDYHLQKNSSGIDEDVCAESFASFRMNYRDVVQSLKRRFKLSTSSELDGDDEYKCSDDQYKCGDDQYKFGVDEYNRSNDEYKCCDDEYICGDDEYTCSHDEYKCTHDEYKCSHDEYKCSHDEYKCSHDEYKCSHDDSLEIIQDLSCSSKDDGEILIKPVARTRLKLLHEAPSTLGQFELVNKVSDKDVDATSQHSNKSSSDTSHKIIFGVDDKPSTSKQLEFVGLFDTASHKDVVHDFNQQPNTLRHVEFVDGASQVVGYGTSYDSKLSELGDVLKVSAQKSSTLDEAGLVELKNLKLHEESNGATVLGGVLKTAKEVPIVCGFHQNNAFVNPKRDEIKIGDGDGPSMSVGFQCEVDGLTSYNCGQNKCGDGFVTDENSLSFEDGVNIVGAVAFDGRNTRRLSHKVKNKLEGKVTTKIGKYGRCDMENKEDDQMKVDKNKEEIKDIHKVPTKSVLLSPKVMEKGVVLDMNNQEDGQRKLDKNKEAKGKDIQKDPMKLKPLTPKEMEEEEVNVFKLSNMFERALQSSKDQEAAVEITSETSKEQELLAFKGIQTVRKALDSSEEQSKFDSKPNSVHKVEIPSETVRGDLDSSKGQSKFVSKPNSVPKVDISLETVRKEALESFEEQSKFVSTPNSVHKVEISSETVRGDLDSSEGQSKFVSKPNSVPKVDIPLETVRMEALDSSEEQSQFVSKPNLVPKVDISLETVRKALDSSEGQSKFVSTPNSVHKVEITSKTVRGDDLDSSEEQLKFISQPHSVPTVDITSKLARKTLGSWGEHPKYVSKLNTEKKVEITSETSETSEKQDLSTFSKDNIDETAHKIMSTVVKPIENTAYEVQFKENEDNTSILENASIAVCAHLSSKSLPSHANCHANVAPFRDASIRRNSTSNPHHVDTDVARHMDGAASKLKSEGEGEDDDQSTHLNTLRPPEENGEQPCDDSIDIMSITTKVTPDPSAENFFKTGSVSDDVASEHNPYVEMLKTPEDRVFENLSPVKERREFFTVTMTGEQTPTSQSRSTGSSETVKALKKRFENIRSEPAVHVASKPDVVLDCGPTFHDLKGATRRVVVDGAVSNDSEVAITEQVLGTPIGSSTSVVGRRSQLDIGNRESFEMAKKMFENKPN